LQLSQWEPTLELVYNQYRQCQVESDIMVKDLLTDKMSEVYPAGKRNSSGADMHTDGQDRLDKM
jgi:hypothetical protein